MRPGLLFSRLFGLVRSARPFSQPAPTPFSQACLKVFELILYLLDMRKTWRIKQTQSRWNDRFPPYAG